MLQYAGIKEVQPPYYLIRVESLTQDEIGKGIEGMDLVRDLSLDRYGSGEQQHYGKSYGEVLMVPKGWKDVPYYPAQEDRPYWRDSTNSQQGPILLKQPKVKVGAVVFLHKRSLKNKNLYLGRDPEGSHYFLVPGDQLVAVKRKGAVYPLNGRLAIKETRGKGLRNSSLVLPLEVSTHFTDDGAVGTLERLPCPLYSPVRLQQGERIILRDGAKQAVDVDGETYFFPRPDQVAGCITALSSVHPQGRYVALKLAQLGSRQLFMGATVSVDICRGYVQGTGKGCRHALKAWEMVYMVQLNDLIVLPHLGMVLQHEANLVMRQTTHGDLQVLGDRVAIRMDRDVTAMSPAFGYEQVLVGKESQTHIMEGTVALVPEGEEALKGAKVLWHKEAGVPVKVGSTLYMVVRKGSLLCKCGNV